MDTTTKGLLYGMAGIAAFSITLPATKFAIAELDPTLVGLGRAGLAAIAAAILLLLTRQSIPSRRHFGSLLVVVFGVIIGFPWLSSQALRELPASHSAVFVGVLPLLTTLVGMVRAGERPSNAFWLMSVLGSVLVIFFAVVSGANETHKADLIMLLAVVFAAFGYAEGARLARIIGGWQVISWALLLSVPFLLLPLFEAVVQYGAKASLTAWLSFIYLGLVSQLLAFFAWYHGLAMAGIARVSQLQLLQPFLAIFVSSLWLGEKVSGVTIGFALAVAATVVLGRKMPVGRMDEAKHNPSIVNRDW